MAEQIDIWSTEARELMPGFNGHFVHSERATLVYWDIDPDAILPEHSHPHEQIVNVLEGTFELVMEGASHILGPGDVLVIPGDVPHSGRAHTGGKIIDVFSPVREDYR